MNSIHYRMANPWGLHARSAAYVVLVAKTCAPHWEVIATARGCEADAKSIMSVMMLAAGYGTEIEFFSLMPDEHWAQFTASLESLFFITDHQGNKANAYAPVEEILKIVGSQDSSCATIRSEMLTRSSKYNCRPFFERLEPEANRLPDTGNAAQTGTLNLSIVTIDTFISYDSKDFSYATSIYDALLDKGLNPFLAGASLPKSGTTDFQLAIGKALDKAKSMILVATDPAYLEGGWVRAEWTTFLNEKRAGRKTGNLVIVTPKRVAVSDLPVMLRMFQSEELPDYGPLSSVSIERLIEFLGVDTNGTKPFVPPDHR